MRIIHGYPDFFGGGGVANAVGALASAQAALGLDITLVARDLAGDSQSPPPPLTDGIEVRRWHPRAGSSRAQAALPASTPREAALLRAIAPDLVHVPGEFHPEHLYVPRLWPDAAYVVSPHGGFHPEVFARGHRALKRAYLTLARRTLYRRAELHALSPLEREHLRQLMPHLAVSCIHNGPGRAVPEQIEPAALPGEDSYRFVYVGRLNVPEKGLDLALEGLAAARRAGEADACLILVGPDWQGGRRLLLAEAERLGVADRLHAIGAVEPDLVPCVVAACDCYLQPARNDGFGLAVAEALLVEKPAVISNVVGAANFAELASLPHLVVCETTPESVRQAMRLAIARRDDLRREALRHRAAVRTFLSWDHVARAHATRYRDLLAMSPRAVVTPAVASDTAS